MIDLLYLSSRHAIHHRFRTSILILCLAVAAYLPAIVQTLTVRYEESLSARAESTPMVMGAKGNRFDLVLGALYFRHSEIDPIPYGEFEALLATNAGLAVPLNLRFTARGFPVVATSTEYFDVRKLSIEAGARPLRVGDVVLGSVAAAALDVGTGGVVFSDQRLAFDITESPSIALRVVGVLAASDSPDDNAVFTDIRTAWLLEGAMHGHAEATDADPRAVYAETDHGVVLNSAVRQLNQITSENADRFHIHGSESELPLSAVLFFPDTPKDATLIKAKVNASSAHQMLVPREVVDDLLGFVFRIKGFLDLVAVTLAVCVGLMAMLLFILTTQLRAPEMRTLNRIGCGRFAVAGLYAAEIAAIFLASAMLAGVGVGVTLLLLPDLITTL